MLTPVRWKHIHSFMFLYEISEEGQIRNRSTLRIKPQKILRSGARTVELSTGKHRRLSVPVADLLDRYWPLTEYPDCWRVKRKKEVDAGSGYLSRHEMLEIMDSYDIPIDIWRSKRYSVPRKRISRVRLFQAWFGKQLLEHGREALSEQEAKHWLDSEERGFRIRSILQGASVVDETPRQRVVQGVH